MFRICLHCEFVYLFSAFAERFGVFFPAFSPGILASILGSLLLRECRCPFLDNNSVAISLVTGLSVTCEVFDILLQPATLLGTNGNLARNTPFHTPPYRRTVSVALHTCVRHDNAKRIIVLKIIFVHWGAYELK